MNNSYNNNTPRVVGGFVIAAILIIGVYTLVIKKADTSALTGNTATNSQVSTETPAVAATQPSPTPTITTAPAPAAAAVTSPYKDGTYTKTTRYRVPGESNSLTATIAIKDGIITSVTTTSQYGDRESSQYISSFESRINNTVKGKALGNAFIGRVGGASLTSGAFNDIIDAVTLDAKV